MSRWNSLLCSTFTKEPNKQFQSWAWVLGLFHKLCDLKWGHLNSEGDKVYICKVKGHGLISKGVAFYEQNSQVNCAYLFTQQSMEETFRATKKSRFLQFPSQQAAISGVDCQVEWL